MGRARPDLMKGLRRIPHGNDVILFLVPRRVGRNRFHYRGTPGHRRALPLITFRRIALVFHTLQTLVSERMCYIASTGMEISFGDLMDFKTQYFGEECEQWLSRVGMCVEMNGIAQGEHTASLSW